MTVEIWITLQIFSFGSKSAAKLQILKVHIDRHRDVSILPSAHIILEKADLDEKLKPWSRRKSADGKECVISEEPGFSVK